MNRYLRYLLLLNLTVLTLTVAALVGPMQGLLERLSLASAWLSLLLVCAALLVGPLRVLSGSEPSLNILWRRDMGIWSAISGLLHFVLGTAVSMTPVYMGLHVTSEMAKREFFWGSIAGALAGLLALVLLLISNNSALRKLGALLWKRVQRLAYLLFFAAVLHGALFQMLESRDVFLTALIVIAAVVVAIQCTGFVKRRQRLQDAATK